MQRINGFNHAKDRNWRMLFIYNLYRLACIIALVLILVFGAYRSTFIFFYLKALFVYFLFGVVFLYLGYRRRVDLNQQVLWAGIIDIIVMVLFINALGYIDSGLGILLIGSIALLSILAPGKRAIFFAAIASCMFLIMSGLRYFYEVPADLSEFFSAGVHGAGFFATALTAWYLSSWAKLSETLAQSRAKELANLHQLNEYIVERLQYGVIYVDATQKVRVINTAARQFFNHLSSKNENTHHLKSLSTDLYNKYLEFLAHRHEKQLVAQATLENPYLQIHFYSSHAGEQSSVLIILEDRMNIAQQAQQLKLASLGRFSASIAHELRNPLGAIAHAVQLLGEGASLNQEDARLKELIMNNCERMNIVIKNVLQMSRREQSQPEAIQINAFLREFKRNFTLINSCKLSLNLPKNNKKTVFFDKSQLEQVLVILCDNAMQHGRVGDGQVIINIIVEISAEKTHIHICDEGPGIEKHLRENIFDPFFTTLRTGYGMGLFIAKDLCEINQAQLYLSDKEKGCCFTIHFNSTNEIRL